MPTCHVSQTAILCDLAQQILEHPEEIRPTRVQKDRRGSYIDIRMAEADKREESSTAPKEEGEGEAKHPLEHKWTLWYDAGSGGKGGGGSWGSTLRSVYACKLCSIAIQGR